MNQSASLSSLDVKNSQLVVIDVQERLLPLIVKHETLVPSIRFLMDAAAILHVSAIVTEQYPKGLGPTVDLLRDHPATIRTLEKLRFSAADELLKTGVLAKQIVIAGIETHVCVQQTALELHRQGIQVFVAADCVGSRYADDRDWAFERMANAGIVVTTAEAVAFEWCGVAGTDEFKSLSRLIRARGR